MEGQTSKQIKQPKFSVWNLNKMKGLTEISGIWKYYENVRRTLTALRSRPPILPY